MLSDDLEGWGPGDVREAQEGGVYGFPGGPVVENPPAMREFNLWVGKIPRRTAWQPTPVFLPGESHGQRSLRATVHGVTKSRTRLSDLARIADLLRCTAETNIAL